MNRTNHVGSNNSAPEPGLAEEHTVRRILGGQEYIIPPIQTAEQLRQEIEPLKQMYPGHAWSYDQAEPARLRAERTRDELIRTMNKAESEQAAEEALRRSELQTVREEKKAVEAQLDEKSRELYKAAGAIGVICPEGTVAALLPAIYKRFNHNAELLGELCQRRDTWKLHITRPPDKPVAEQTLQQTTAPEPEVTPDSREAKDEPRARKRRIRWMDYVTMVSSAVLLSQGVGTLLGQFEDMQSAWRNPVGMLVALLIGLGVTYALGSLAEDTARKKALRDFYPEDSRHRSDFRLRATALVLGGLASMGVDTYGLHTSYIARTEFDTGSKLPLILFFLIALIFSGTYLVLKFIHAETEDLAPTPGKAAAGEAPGVTAETAAIAGQTEAYFQSPQEVLSFLEEQIAKEELRKEEAHLQISRTPALWEAMYPVQTLQTKLVRLTERERTLEQPCAIPHHDRMEELYRELRYWLDELQDRKNGKVSSTEQAVAISK